MVKIMGFVLIFVECAATIATRSALGLRTRMSILMLIQQVSTFDLCFDVVHLYGL